MPYRILGVTAVVMPVPLAMLDVMAALILYLMQGETVAGTPGGFDLTATSVFPRHWGFRSRLRR